MNRWDEENLIARIKQVREDMAKEATIYDQARSWPFKEARTLLAHIERKGKVPGDVVTFETGYGPSGAPHIGTFAEVVRTLWVMKAFDALTNGAYHTRLIMFSDDYDAMRKVPDGLPEWMNDYLGKPLTSVPNPYGTDEDSFAEANNMKLVDFVDNILKSYDGSVVGASPDRSRVSFVSSTAYYKAGRFNDMLDKVWDNYDAILGVMLPTLGEDRRATYSPFMPIVPPQWGDVQVLQVPVTLVNEYEIRFIPPSHADSLIPVVSGIHNGLIKLQWKVDWAMRWVHFDVDYEMSGKDLIDSVKASQKICKILGGTPPVGMTYELFLDEDWAKISKSKGNGFTMEEWLTYGTPESLMLFLFQNPKSAKPLHLELVPKFEDEFIKLRQDNLEPNDGPWFFKAQGYDQPIPNVTFSLLLNLAIVSQVKTAEELTRYLVQQHPLGPRDRTWVQLMAHRAILYATKQGLYDRERREPTSTERAAFTDLANRLSMMMPAMAADAFQYQVYEVGKEHGFQPLRLWFKALYECLLGSSDGPRFGVFIVAYGLENTIRLLRQYEEVDA